MTKIINYCIEHPLMVKYRKAWQKYAPKERWGTFYYAGIIWAEPLVEGLIRTGPNLSPESFVRAMESIRDWRGIGPPLTFTATDHQGGKSVKVGKVDAQGNLKPLLDWLTITK